MWIIYNGKLLNNLVRMSFYAVAQGRKVGIFSNWNDCQQQISGFSKAVFKKFKTKDEAEKFIVEKGGGATYLKTLSNDSKIKNPGKFFDKKVKAGIELSSEEKEQQEIDAFIASELKEIEEQELTDQRAASTSKISTSRKRKLSSPIANKQKKSVTKKSSKIPYVPPKSTRPKSFGQYEFQVDEDEFVHAYTDGSSINNGKTNSTAGLGVYFGEDHPLNISQPVKGRPTNNVGEIQAATEAIRVASKHGVEKLMLLTDSQFLINAICLWLPGWKFKGWKTASGQDVKNRTEFQELDFLIERTDMRIKWHYVKAHSGLHGNERADQLAKLGQNMRS